MSHKTTLTAHKKIDSKFIKFDKFSIKVAPIEVALLSTQRKMSDTKFSDVEETTCE